MKYREKLLDLILDDNEDAMMDWIAAQPLLDQPDIFRELQEIGMEAAVANGNDPEMELLSGFGEQIAAYEEHVLDEKLAEAAYIMALEAQENAFAQPDTTFATLREHAIECIITDAPNAEQMRELAELIIQYETDAGIYDPDNWKRIKR